MTDPHDTSPSALNPSESLPEGWVRTNLASIADVNMGQSPESKFYNSEGYGLPFFQGKAEFGRDIPTIKKWCSEPTKVAPARSILLSVRAPIGPTNYAPEECCIGRGLAAINSFDKIENRFIRNYIRSIENWLSQQGTGTTFTAIGGDYLRRLPLPLPPLQEQIRIADKLDALLSRVEAGRERLERVPGLLNRFRQSVLSAAVSGELTREWRGGGDAEWEEGTLGQVLRVSSGNFLPAKSMAADGHIPVYGGNGVNGFHDKANVATRTLVIGRVGFYCGSIHMTPDLAWVTDNALIARFDSSQHDLDFLFYALKAIDLRENDSSSAQPVISGQKIYSLAFSTPPILEQTEIVRRVEALFTIADRIEARYKLALTTFNRLTPALLAKAFRGELVPQDPDDEPASVLLERIRAARAAAGEKPKRGRGAAKGTAKAAVGTGGAPADGAQSKRRGRPPKLQAEAFGPATSIPQAGSYEEAVRRLEAQKVERTQGSRQPGLFEET